MADLTPDQEAVVQALLRDAASTIGENSTFDFASDVAQQVQRFLSFGLDTIEQFRQALVDDFQQHVHDEFIDVSWPRCPRHPNHPLWLIEGIWRCTKDDVAVARLGELPSQE
jgi:hypothetical protein